MILDDEKMEQLQCYKKFVAETKEKIIVFGEIATDFLVQVNGDSFKGYFGGNKIIVTAVDYPEQKFAKEIHEGYSLEVLPILERQGLSFVEIQPKRRLTVNQVLADKEFGHQEYFYPRSEYTPTDEDREVSRERVRSIFK